MKKQQIRALLIEDDDDYFLLIKHKLKKSRTPIELVWSECLQVGLSELQENPFDVVLTDLSLPDSFGLETVEEIRKHDPNIPVVVLTGLNDEAVEMDALSAGAQDYLLKDETTTHSLEKVIHHAIQRQESYVKIQQLLEEVESSRALLAEQQKLLKRKNRRLRKVYRTAHRFVDNVSHEFRTPLTVIKDYISLVREGLLGEVNEEQCRMLDVAAIRTDEMNNMVDDMLDVSKIESGLLGSWRRPCHLSEIGESVCPPLLKRAEVKGIQFDVDIDQSLPAIFCDSEKIGRVISNLVTNAMKFCGDPGIVRLWARREGDAKVLTVGVTDDGPGIDEAGLAEIFERFRQLKTQFKSSTKGFGLGLNIAKELVDLNFGEMSVESQLGEGSTFSFTVPLDEPAEIMTRFLTRLKKHRNGESEVALVRASIDSQTTGSNTDEIDAFMQYLLRASDLLFRLSPHDWLFVLPISSTEIPRFLERIRHEWQKTNRNRPFGPLPSVKTEVIGHWNVCSESESVKAQFATVMGTANSSATKQNLQVEEPFHVG